MKEINFILNSKKVTAKEGETIWQVAKRHGDNIPVSYTHLTLPTTPYV